MAAKRTILLSSRSCEFLEGTQVAWGFTFPWYNYGRKKNDIKKYRDAYKVKLWQAAWGCGRGPSGRRLWIKMNI